MSILFFTIQLVFANCNIPAPPAVVEPGTCVVTANHLEQLKEFYSCREPRKKGEKAKDVRACQEKAKKLSAAALAMIPAAAQLSMSHAERAKMVADFLSSDEVGMVQEIAEEQFKRDNHRPADRKLLRKLKKEHIRLKAQARTQDPQARRRAKVELKKFEFDRNHRGLLRALNIHKGDISKVNIPKPRYRLSDVAKGGDLTKAPLYDIANMDYKKIPPDILEYNNQPNTLIVRSYTKSARQTFLKIKDELLKGNSLKKISALSGVNKEDLKQAKKLITKRALDFKDNFPKNEMGSKFNVRASNDNSNKKRKNKRKAPAWFKKALGLGAEGLMKVGPMAGLFVAAYNVVSIPWEKQENCDKTFPFYPVKYQQSAVVGLPEEMNCKGSFPGASEKAPEKIKRFLALSSSEQHRVLIDGENRKTRFSCRYYRQLYNRLICNGDSSSESETKSLMIDK